MTIPPAPREPMTPNPGIPERRPRPARPVGRTSPVKRALGALGLALVLLLVAAVSGAVFGVLPTWLRMVAALLGLGWLALTLYDDLD